METPASFQSAPGRYSRAAGPLHTILVLVILGAWAFLRGIFGVHMRAAADPHRARIYLLTIVFEWLLFAFVLAGVGRSGASVLLVLGDRWRSRRELLRDIGIALAFWLVSAGLLYVFARLLRIDQLGQKLDYMMPQGAAELVLWLVLSITAGICEETIFRGYLQRQFIAFTKNVPAGILLSGAAFGAAHAYQGVRRMILIALFGIMFGVLAHWRRSVRPGMIAHVWQDSLNGVLAGMARH